MIITCTKDSKWQKTDGSIVNFKDKEDLEVGVNVSDEIAEDMLRCDYAIPKQGKHIETKKEAVKPLEKKEDEPFDIQAANPDELEAFARKELGLELDKRKKMKTLRKEVMEAIEEKNNE